MSELILMVDEEGRIRRVNQTFASRLGKKPAQLVGQHWYSVLDGNDVSASNSPLAQMFRSRAAVEAPCTHANLPETQATAIPLLEGETLVGAIYVLRPRDQEGNLQPKPL